MDSAEIAGLTFVLIALLGLQALATLRVWRSDDYDREHKAAQTRLIWMVPLIGAVVVLLVYGDAERARKS
jgi:hypothetical protein